MRSHVVGTQRYMSPEQALGQRAVMDHRTDVYSLGATLYELLTLRPAHDGGDQEELLRQIAFEEPKPPRRLNPAVPVELQTIVLKALEKSAADRYATAQELADDLGRFLRDEPIRARRAPLTRRMRRWSRRHRPLVATVATLLMTLALGAGSWIAWHQRMQSRTEREVDVALAEANTFNAQGWEQKDDPDRWQATVGLESSAVQRAEGFLATGVATEELADRVRAARAAAEEAARASRLRAELDRIRLEQAAIKGQGFDFRSALPLYATALREYGIDPTAPEAAAERVRSSPLREVLLAALEDWARFAPEQGDRQRILQVLCLAEPQREAPAGECRRALRGGLALPAAVQATHRRRRPLLRGRLCR
jgi:hypothetical protein